MNTAPRLPGAVARGTPDFATLIWPTLIPKCGPPATLTDPCRSQRDRGGLVGQEGAWCITVPTGTAKMEIPARLRDTPIGARLTLPLEVCPTDVILAPAERVWQLLTNPHELAQWSGTKLVEGHARAMSAGDRLVFRVGMLHITFDVLDVQAPRQLTLDIGLPFGVKNREQIQTT